MNVVINMIDIENNELVEDFKKYLMLERRYSDNTVESYIRDVRMFLISLGKDVDDISKGDIEDYILEILPTLDSSSINRKIASIKSFFKYLCNFRGFVNVAEGLESLKRKQRLPKYLTIEEVDRLLNIKLESAFDYRNKAMLELLYATGLRASELINLDTTNLDLFNMTLKVHGKGNKERIVPVSKMAIKYLALYLAEYRSKLFVKKKKACDKLFLNNHGCGLTRQGLYKILKELSVNAGIDKDITPHVLRHSFATHLIECGADIRSVQELLGHENAETTEVYTHLANNFVAESYNKYFNRNKNGDEVNV